ncbi:hypothetical protein SGPA1_30348 [Streptomyces misionensis JCM 4497]
MGPGPQVRFRGHFWEIREQRDLKGRAAGETRTVPGHKTASPCSPPPTPAVSTGSCPV